MKNSSFANGQIVLIVVEQEASAKTANSDHRYSVSDATSHKWKAEYGGPTA